MTLSVQFTTMAVMVLSGIYLGMAHDTFRRLSIHWAKKTITSYVLEVSFWLLQTLIIFYCLFLVNAGELRFYIILACLLGFSAYEALVKKGFRFLLEKILTGLRAIYTFFRKIITVLFITPLTWLILVCLSIVLFLLRLFVKIIGFLLSLILSPFRFIGRFIKPWIPERIIKFFHKSASFYSTIRERLRKALKDVTLKRR